MFSLTLPQGGRTGQPVFGRKVPQGGNPAEGEPQWLGISFPECSRCDLQTAICLRHPQYLCRRTYRGLVPESPCECRTFAGVSPASPVPVSVAPGGPVRPGHWNSVVQQL